MERIWMQINFYSSAGELKVISHPNSYNRVVVSSYNNDISSFVFLL